MAQPFAHIRHLILATARKAFPFMVLSCAGVRGYFATSEDAENFVNQEAA